MKKQWIVALCVILIVSLQQVRAQDDKLAPYLYYYSDTLKGIVFERADGSDSRVMGQGVMHPFHDHILEPLWSPSGRWMAWLSALERAPAVNYYSASIISTDGERRLTMLDHSPEARVMVNKIGWATDRDWLFVAETVENTNTEGAVIRYLLIDAESEDVLAYYERPLAGFSPSDFHGALWLSDGSGVAFAVTASSAGEIIHEQVILLADGTVLSKVLPSRAYLYLAPDGKVAYPSHDDQLLIDDLLNDRAYSYSITPQERYYSDFNWNPIHPIALFYEYSAGNNYDLWLIDLTKQDRQLIDTGVQKVDLVTYFEGYQRVAERDNVWSPDGSRHIFKTAEGAYYLLDVTDGAITQLDNFPEHQMMRWSDNAQQVILENTDGVFVYDLLSQQSTHIINSLIPFRDNDKRIDSAYTPSPLGNYLGLRSDYALMSVWHGVRYPIAPHSGAVDVPAEGGRYDWYPDEKWVIVGFRVRYSAGMGQMAYGVLRVDDLVFHQPNIQRELEMTGGGAGWLPEHVIPHIGD
jgi:hypothetical protein